MFIAVEGIDGAGKTSLSKALASKLNYEYSGQKALSAYMSIPDSQYLTYCHNYRNAVKTDRTSMFMLYALSCYLAGKNQNVVCDRHLGTVFFWYGSDSALLIADTIYKLTNKPDITIVLDVTAATAKKRVENKLENNSIDRFEAERDFEKASKAGEFLGEIIPFLQHFELPYIVVDANEKSLNEILDEALLAINNVCNRKSNLHKIE